MTKQDHRCLRCNRKLKDEVSIERGYGEVCYKKHMEQVNNKQPLFSTKEDVMSNVRKLKSKKTKSDKSESNLKLRKTELDILVSGAIELAVNNYSAAMLLACRDQLGFGPKRAKKFSHEVLEVFTDITNGIISFEDVKQTIEDELKIKIM